MKRCQRRLAQAFAAETFTSSVFASRKRKTELRFVKGDSRLFSDLPEMSAQ